MMLQDTEDYNLISKLYKWNIPIVYIRLYRFMVDKLKIDIKF